MPTEDARYVYLDADEDGAYEHLFTRTSWSLAWQQTTFSHTHRRQSSGCAKRPKSMVQACGAPVSERRPIEASHASHATGGPHSQALYAPAARPRRPGDRLKMS